MTTEPGGSAESRDALSDGDPIDGEIVEDELRARELERQDRDPQPGQLPIPGMATISRRTSGPLPAAREFAGYDAVLPGAADRILRMAEMSLQHEIEMDKRHTDIADRAEQHAAELDSKAEDNENDAVRRAQRIAGTILILILVITGYAVYLGQALAAIVIALAGLGTVLVALFGVGRKRAAEPDERDPAAEGDAPGERDDNAV